jgi:hypothetical protein
VVSASAAFALVAGALQLLALPFGALAIGAFVSLVIALVALPAATSRAVVVLSPRWDLPARMVIATALVLTITGLAALLGPRLSGVLASFPVYAAILTVFAHRAGPGPAVQVLRGLLMGLFAFAGFFVVLGVLIERVGMAIAFAAAITCALAIQAMSLGRVVISGSR